ncbi:Asp-tRNA(Asn)/Glu-tRNA(Gln) amidotransferase subunit GatC [Thalassospiraceae bacterium LMO-JJ14]|nr:Asp-tRNA(Asn)/Glu-tRNA(Gln) amidotransferase subunit GatC [Thalassospiraceae bacterium LMO-JJ14]
MSLTKDDVRKIAFLARIRVPDERLEPLAGELNNIVGWVEQLGEIDTAGVAPMTSVVEIETPMRDDLVTDGGMPEKVLANAPDGEGRFYGVPKVVE